MRKMVLTTACLSVLVLAGCEGMTSNQRMAVGGLAGATAGLITAEALDANDNWRIIAALGGAAAGSVVARNTQSNECAYARGDGTYYKAPCP